MHPRHGVPEPGHDRQAAFHLVEHRRPRGPQEFRLPQDAEFAADVILQPDTLAGEQVVAVELLQIVPHPPQLGANRASLRLAGVRREHELDRHSVDRPLDLGGRQAQRTQFGDPGGERRD